jgi:hypothetical protein
MRLSIGGSATLTTVRLMYLALNGVTWNGICCSCLAGWQFQHEVEPCYVECFKRLCGPIQASLFYPRPLPVSPSCLVALLMFVSCCCSFKLVECSKA